jgi:hypothetical protein
MPKARIPNPASNGGTEVAQADVTSPKLFIDNSSDHTKTQIFAKYEVYTVQV